MKHYYGIANYYGNRVYGYECIHIFEDKKSRDAWVNEEPEFREITYAKHPYIRIINDNNRHGLAFFVRHDADGEYDVTKNNYGNDYIQKR